jgi:glutathione S-transferase
MPDAIHLAAIDTLLAVLLTMVMAARVGHLRGKYKIEAPATVGHPAFERGYRIHMNTVENMTLVLPALWIATYFYGGQIPFWLGLIWVLSRIVYGVGYSQDNTQLRAPGAITGVLMQFALLVLGAIGIFSSHAP